MTNEAMSEKKYVWGELRDIPAYKGQKPIYVHEHGEAIDKEKLIEWLKEREFKSGITGLILIKIKSGEFDLE